MNYETLEVNESDAVIEITLSRPELLNRFDAALQEDLASALSEIRQSSARAVVLASTGKVFSAGGDLDYIKRCNSEEGTRTGAVDLSRRLWAELLALPQPVTAAVQGNIYGVALTTVMACDSVVAARSVRFVDPHVALGVMAGVAGCLTWPQSVGMLRARRYLLTSDPLDAETASQIGMLTDLVDTADEVLPRARAIAARIASHPPLAVQGTKLALNRLSYHRFREIEEVAYDAELATLASADMLEAIAAFSEQRPGRFDGR